jgi:hypothetical protein
LLPGSGLTAGKSGTCTLTVANAGPALAEGRGGGDWPLSVTGCSGGCPQAGALAGWTLGSLPAGQSITLTITVTAIRAGTAVFAAATGSASPDPASFNNLAAATVKITRS